MHGIRRYTFAAICALGFATQALALPHSPSERVQLFATCLGTLYAVDTEQRVVAGQTRGQTQDMIHHFEALLDATLPDALDYGMPESMMWRWRVAAQNGHGLLLIRAHYGVDHRAARDARRALAAALQTCQKVVPNA